MQQKFNRKRTPISHKKPNSELFNFQPVLKGSYVEVRPLQTKDKEALYAVASDPLLWEQHPCSRYIREEFNTFFIESLTCKSALLVIDTCTQAVIGSSRYHGLNEENSSIEIGWTFLARSHWGGKYNSDLKKIMLAHAFVFVDTVVFYINQTNRRSQRSVEKIGAVRDKELDDKGRVSYRLRKSAFY